MTRKYFINGKETTRDITLKYLELMLDCGTKQISELDVRFEDENF